MSNNLRISRGRNAVHRCESLLLGFLVLFLAVGFALGFGFAFGFHLSFDFPPAVLCFLPFLCVEVLGLVR